jgi:hypothetical protein
MKSSAIQPGAPPRDPIVSGPGTAVAQQPVNIEQPQFRQLALAALQRLASLRLTVVLFVLSLLLVFWGTWAQVDAGIWTIVAKYFRSALVFIPLRTICFNIPDLHSDFGRIAIPYPGGWLLGGLLLANLLAAHLVRFRLTWQRSGILLIHSGLIVMMLGEVVAGTLQEEGRMTIPQGHAVSWVDHDRTYELAVVQRLEGEDREVIIPQRFLMGTNSITHPKLPFEIKPVRYMVNSDLVDFSAAKHGPNPATAGVGVIRFAIERPEVSGVEDQKIDAPSAYVELIDRETLKPLGTYLVSTWHSLLMRPPDEVAAGDGKWRLELRPKRSYRSYTVHLKKFTHDKYDGTDTPKNYQSDVIVTDPESKDRFEYKIWMNHPLRHRGETFYQSSLHPFTRGTVLQVVRNPGWLMPYIACGMVSIGMLFHFGLHLREFLRRRLSA